MSARCWTSLANRASPEAPDQSWLPCSHVPCACRTRAGTETTPPGKTVAAGTSLSGHGSRLWVEGQVQRCQLSGNSRIFRRLSLVCSGNGPGLSTPRSNESPLVVSFLRSRSGQIRGKLCRMLTFPNRMNEFLNSSHDAVYDSRATTSETKRHTGRPADYEVRANLISVSMASFDQAGSVVIAIAPSASATARQARSPSDSPAPRVASRSFPARIA